MCVYHRHFSHICVWMSETIHWFLTHTVYLKPHLGLQYRSITTRSLSSSALWSHTHTHTNSLLVNGDCATHDSLDRLFKTTDKGVLCVSIVWLCLSSMNKRSLTVEWEWQQEESFHDKPCYCHFLTEGGMWDTQDIYWRTLIFVHILE